MYLQICSCSHPSASPHFCPVLPFYCPHQHNCLYGPIVNWITAVCLKNWNPIWKMQVSGEEAGDDSSDRECLICFTAKPASPWSASLPAVWKAALRRDALTLGAPGFPQGSCNQLTKQLEFFWSCWVQFLKTKCESPSCLLCLHPRISIFLPK